MFANSIKSDERINLIPLSVVPLPTAFDDIDKVSCARIIMRPLVVLTEAIVGSEEAINAHFDSGETVHDLWREVLRPACLKVYEDEYGEQAESYLEKDEAFYNLEHLVWTITPRPKNTLRTGLYAMVAHQ